MDPFVKAIRRGTWPRWSLWIVLLLCCDGAWAAPSVGEPNHVRVELLTMGQGLRFYSAFGHAALRVRSKDADLVYNFGYTSFEDPKLAIHFARGEATFWAATSTFARTMRHYRLVDRTVYRQQLNLTPGQHRRLAALLASTVSGPESRYQYHHYFDNCATRLRDAIDDAVDGAVREQLQGQPTAFTLRQLTREGFARVLPLLLFTDYLLGRPIEQVIDWWQAAFLPELLSQGLERVSVHGRPLAGPRITLYRRGEPLPPGNPLGAVWALAAAAVALTLLAGLAGMLYRRGNRSSGLLLLPVVLSLGLLSLPLWFAVLFTSLWELRLNELVLLFWPTDLLLLGLCWRWLRGRFVAGRLLRAYVRARVLIVSLAALGHAVGLLTQRPLIWLAVVGLPLLALHLALRRPPTPVTDPSA